MPAYPGHVCSSVNKVQSNKVQRVISLIYASWKFLRLRNSVWDFLGLIFGRGIFWGVLLEALGIFLGFDFCPHSIILASFAILSTPSPRWEQYETRSGRYSCFFFDTCTLIPFQNSPYRKLLVHSFLYLTVLNRPHKVTENVYLAILMRSASIDSIALFYSYL